MKIIEIILKSLEKRWEYANFLKKSLIIHIKFLIFIEIWAKCLKKFYKNNWRNLVRKNSGKICRNYEKVFETSKKS